MFPATGLSSSDTISISLLRNRYGRRAKERRAQLIKNRKADAISAKLSKTEAVAVAESERMVALVEEAVNRHRRNGTLFSSFHDQGFSFCVASVTMYGRTERGDIYPAEFSVMRGTLVDGVLPEFVMHKILKCDEVPARYRRQFRRLVRSTHRIPLDFEGCAAYSDMISEFSSIVNRCVSLLLNDK